MTVNSEGIKEKSLILTEPGVVAAGVAAGAGADEPQALKRKALTTISDRAIIFFTWVSIALFY